MPLHLLVTEVHLGQVWLIDDIRRRTDPASNTVLLIDDSRLVRRKVAKDLKASDPNVVIYEAENGQMGLEKLEEIRGKHNKDPLFIVLDLGMPVMDGRTALAHLRKDYTKRGLSQGIPVIVLSSSTGEVGSFIFKKSVHAGKSDYEPLVTVAKEGCVRPGSYDAQGEKGLHTWLEHLAKPGRK